MQRSMAALMCGALWAVAAVGAIGQGDPLSAMLDAERAFARMSVAAGQREAFIEFFAEEGLVFNPGPVNAREFYRQRPPTPLPPPRVLDWEPAAGDVALSGDLGFSTGPFVIQEHPSGKRLGGGWFFSVWKRQAGGDWRVLVDLGVPSSDAVPLRPRSVERLTPPGAGGPPAGGEGTPLEAIRRVDTDLSERLRRGEVAKYLDHVMDRTRVYRTGQPPALGRGAIRDLLENGPRPTCRPVAAGISGASDFAYVYGTFETPSADGKAAKQGGFVRVWRQVNGAWMLAAEVLS